MLQSGALSRGAVHGATARCGVGGGGGSGGGGERGEGRGERVAPRKAYCTLITPDTLCVIIDLCSRAIIDS